MGVLWLNEPGLPTSQILIEIFFHFTIVFCPAWVKIGVGGIRVAGCGKEPQYHPKPLFWGRFHRTPWVESLSSESASRLGSPPTNKESSLAFVAPCIISCHFPTVGASSVGSHTVIALNCNGKRSGQQSSQNSPQPLCKSA